MSEENKAEATKPESAASEIPVHDANKKSAVDASGRLRDEKGHFLTSSPDGKSRKHTKKKSTLKKEIDENTVKIRIVKEEKPLPPKEFEGKLEDEKERTAISFIRSIIANKPKRIDIDGTRYYAADILVRFGVALKKERELNKEAETLIEAANTALKVANEELEESNKFSENIERSYDKLYKRKTIWKCLAIGLVVGEIVVGIMPAAYRFAKNKWFCEKAPVAEQNQTEVVTGE